MPNFMPVSAAESERISRVAARDLGAAGMVLRRRGKLREDLRKMVLLDDLAVGSDVPLGDAVNVCAADVVSVKGEMLGDRLDNVLSRAHRLRAAEAAKRRVRRQIREADAAAEIGVRNVVGVVGVQQRPFQNRRREVERAAAVGEEIVLQRVDATVAFEADFPADEIRVPLAGRTHVGVFVENHPRGTARLAGDAAIIAGIAACVSLPPKPPPMRFVTQTTS
jgi:hypothetical protein